MAGDIQLQCSDCGQDFTFTAADQAFFQERGYSTPKRCKNCRQAKKNDQGGSGYRSAPAQGTPVICSGCGQPTTVPFEPRGDRPVFCRDCYQARKGSGGGGSAVALLSLSPSASSASPLVALHLLGPAPALAAPVRRGAAPSLAFSLSPSPSPPNLLGLAHPALFP